MTTRHARCVCGGLTLTAEGDPVRGGICSCLHCQQRTGSVAAVVAVFAEDQIAVDGPSQVFRRPSEDSPAETSFHFCPTCGTTLYWRNTGMPGMVLVAVGCFGDPDFPPPRGAIFGERRPAWMTFPDTIKEG